MNRREAERRLVSELKSTYGEGEATAMARLVMDEFDGTASGAPSDKALSNEDEDRLAFYVERLKSHEPVQYVLNKAWFCNLPLYVNPSVLIPRPETEELVDWILRDLKASGLPVFRKAPTDADATTQLKILDIGTGSGCIALALKKAAPLAEVWGCDVSDEALNVARRNGSALDIRVDFQGVDILDEAQQRSLPTVDIIVSNPPYVPLSNKASMHRNVTNHEPPQALFVPDNDSLIFYKAIAAFAEKRLYPSGSIYLEVHEDLAGHVAELFFTKGYADVAIKKDMQGKERMVRARTSNVKRET